MIPRKRTRIGRATTTTSVSSSGSAGRSTPTILPVTPSTGPTDPSSWQAVPGFDDLVDVTYHRHVTDGTVRVAFDRPEVRNAFRPGTVDELYRVMDHARMTSDVGTVLLTGNGPAPKDGVWAFCSGG